MSTIAAVASGMITSGIGIIRISGEEAIAVADKLFHAKKPLRDAESHTVNYGLIYDGDNKIDEAVVLVMKAPRSYTGEDVVEIQCHGGPYIMKKILDAVVSAGAKLAAPGEFTKRAFLNGRLDLSQAEAVMELIESDSEYARKSAISQLGGSLSGEIADIRAKIIYDTAYLEAALDDPEHISLDGYAERLSETVVGAKARVERLIQASEEGKILREGINTVILGRPNAGKSTLLNLLLGEERAIVTDIPGTTRDTLEESVRMGDISLRLVDTAGLRETSDVVEKIGVDKAYEAAAEADLILYVVDGSDEGGIDAAQIEEIQSLDKAILVYNKADKTGGDGAPSGLSCPVVSFSAKTGMGKDELIEEIYKMFYDGKLAVMEGELIANARQKEALSEALGALNNVENGLNSGVPEDLLTVDLMGAYEALGKITGESVHEDLVDEIFDKFCMGK